MQQASRPPSHRRWVWRSRRVCDGDGSLPGAIRLVQQLPRLMPAVEGVVPGRRRPVGQHRKCLVAWATTAPANPDPLVPFVVRIFEALSVTDDGPLAANRAQPGEQFQRDLGHPGSVLFSGSGSAIKRITAGVKAGPDRRCQVSIWWLAFTLQVKSVPNEKRISRSAYCPHDLVSTLAGLKRRPDPEGTPAWTPAPQCRSTLMALNCLQRQSPRHGGELVSRTNPAGAKSCCEYPADRRHE